MTGFHPTVAQAWLLLVVAGVFEVCWAVGMKYAEGFTRLAPTVFVVVTALLSFYLLALAMKALPAGTAYAVWVGIGAVGVALLGIGLLGEPATVARFVSILLIVAGVTGLRVFG